MDRVIELLYRCPKNLLFATAFCLVVLIGMADYLSGLEISVSLLYLIPICLVSWYVGRKEGTIISLLATIDWFLADWFGTHSYSHPAIPYWNALVELSFFLIITNTLSSLRQKWQIEKDLARTDALTKIANRRAFFETANLELERGLRYQHALSLAYMDLDNFKWVNDNLGHQTGDKLLICVAETLKQKTRLNDTVARLGGDEFAILLPETSPEAAKIVMEKLQQGLIVKMEQNSWPVTFSIGLVSFQTPPSSINRIIHEADLLMYDVKKSGKNNIQHKIFLEESKLHIS